MLTKPNINKPAFQHPDFRVEAMYTQIGLCPMCQSPIHEEDFTDEISRREYSISGLCQKCQDEIFQPPLDE
jgi:transcription initiation factor IIE alpha subunit